MKYIPIKEKLHHYLIVLDVPAPHDDWIEVHRSISVVVSINVHAVRLIASFISFKDLDYET